MLQSPTKRRKVSSTTSVPVESSNAQNRTRSNPTTPTRASYLSPTKASLARSHPNILARSPGRGIQAASNGRNLRQEILGERNNQKPPKNNDGLPSEPQTPRHRDTDITASVPAMATDSFSAAVARTFEIPQQNQSAPRSPLQSRQPSAQNAPTPGRANSLEALPALALPKLVKRPHPTSAQAQRARHMDLDLPPTPVQLGLDPAPERPRGLASSSSPRSSRSGSGKNRRRLRAGAVTSSPLKPKDNAPAVKEVAIVRETSSRREQTVEEAPESQAEDTEEIRISVPEETREKQTLRRGLEEQLKRLKSEFDRLEGALDSPGDSSPDVIDSELLSLLTTMNPSCAQVNTETRSRSPSTAFHNPIDLGDQTQPYLTLFASGNLQLSATTSTRTADGHIQMVHDLTLTAPPPWARHIFSTTFEVITDAEDARIESVTLKSPRRKRGSKLHAGTISGWIDSHLETPLQRFDIGGIVWGLGRSFEECVRRAKVFRVLDYRYGRNKGDDANMGGSFDHTKKEVTPLDTKTLGTYLSRHQLEFSLKSLPPAGDPHTRGKPKSQLSSRAKILLSWTIEPDWTGEVASAIDVTTTGISRKAQESVKDVFATFLRRKGVVEAFVAVWEVLEGQKV